MSVRSSLLAGLAASLCVPGALAGDLKPNILFTSNAVLQREVSAPVWGTAAPNAQVSVELAGGTAPVTATATADDKGNWLAKIATGPAATGRTLTIKSGTDTIKLDNIAIGEVWICSGQSNMEWSVNASFEPEKVKAAAANPNLRLYTIPKQAAPEPQTTVKFIPWAPCTSENVGGFSAVGYHFGSHLQKALNVPVGMIHTSWGGTPAQAWTSREALANQPSLKYYVDNLKKNADSFDPVKAEADYKVALEKHKAALEKHKEALVKHKEAVEKAKADGKPAPDAPKAPAAPKPPTKPGSGQNDPSALYNAMIAPLVPYGIKGAIWYQGESNASKAFEYRTLMPTMITDWRTQFKQGDFPFYMVQLAPFMAIDKEPKDSAWAELREAQFLTSQKLPHTGQAVITDVGDEKDIHPRKKEPIGARLALLARANAYGEKIVANGPIYQALKIDGNKAIVSFTSVGAGLEAKGEKLTGFALAGADKVFHHATATIEGDKVVVTCDKVKEPVAVRFGWANYPVVNLWNKDGLPATPFRTDDFPMVTAPKPSTPEPAKK
jgi:sialate O-acetylesterase